MVMLLPFCAFAANAADAPQMKTYTYKQVGDLPIKADVYTSGDRAERPVVVSIHGGALIMGNREGVDRRRAERRVLEQGYAFVSIDYRLAPETQLPQIIEDVEDAFRWIRDKGPQLFHANPERIAVLGGSAGGYLTLTTGFRVKPRPVAWLGGGPSGAMATLSVRGTAEPSPHPRHHQSKLFAARRGLSAGGGTLRLPTPATGKEMVETFLPVLPAAGVVAESCFGMGSEDRGEEIRPLRARPQCLGQVSADAADPRRPRHRSVPLRTIGADGGGGSRSTMSNIGSSPFPAENTAWVAVTRI